MPRDATRKTGVAKTYPAAHLIPERLSEFQGSAQNKCSSNTVRYQPSITQALETPALFLQCWAPHRNSAGVLGALGRFTLVSSHISGNFNHTSVSLTGRLKTRAVLLCTEGKVSPEFKALNRIYHQRNYTLGKMAGAYQCIFPLMRISPCSLRVSSSKYRPSKC